MNKLEQNVSKYINKVNLIEYGNKVLIGVSGGADSMALLHFVCNQKNKMNLNIVVAHFNHMFRGEESDGDEQFVKKFCSEMGVQFECRRQNLPEIIKETGENTQATSRKYRYKFFEEIVAKHQIDKLALAHHLDDLAENMLMNIVRGVQSPQRLGIPARRQFADIELVRPFMVVAKNEVLEYCRQNSIPFREDSSNSNHKYSRNRMRGNIMPLLKEENPQMLSHLAKFYEQISEDEEYIGRQAKEAFNGVEITDADNVFTVEINKILDVDKALQRRILQLILEYLFDIKKFDFSNIHLDLLLELLNEAQSSSILQIDESFFAEKSFDKILFYFEKRNATYFEIDLNLRGETILPNGDKIVAECIKEAAPIVLSETEFITSENVGKLAVRTRRDGDRVEKQGLHGRKKLKKLFLEMKIPIHERDVWPIISLKENTNEIVWIPHVFKKNLEHENEDVFYKLKYFKNNDGGL